MLLKVGGNYKNVTRYPYKSSNFSMVVDRSIFNLNLCRWLLFQFDNFLVNNMYIQIKYMFYQEDDSALLNCI